MTKKWISYELLAEMPRAFRAWTGLCKEEFDELFDKFSTREPIENGNESPSRNRGGHPFALSLKERLLLALIYIRHRPDPDSLGTWFGVSRTTTWRSRLSIQPLLEVLGREDLWERTPDEIRKREIADALDEMPMLQYLWEDFRWGEHWDWTFPDKRPFRLPRYLASLMD